MKSMEVYIEGMHCNNCVVLIKEEFKKISGIKDVKVNLKKSSALLSYEKEEPAMDFLNKAVNDYGYKVTLEKAVSKPQTRQGFIPWLVGFVVAGLILVLYSFLQRSGIIDKFQPGSGTFSAGMAVMLGVIASLSTCFAVVGSIVIAFSSLYGSAQDSKPAVSAFHANLFFHISRLVSFFLLGGLLGWIGGSLSLSGRFYGIYMVILGIVMFIMALQILGINKITARLGWNMPAPLFKLFSRLKNSKNPMAPFLLGALSFFLPCGFTQSMQVAALGSGGFLSGALILFFFALGTLPVLFLAGMTTAWFRFKGIPGLQKTAGFLLVAFSIYMFASAMPLFSYDKAVLISDPQTSNTSDTDVSTGTTGPGTPDSAVPGNDTADNTGETPDKPPAPPKAEESESTGEAVQLIEMHVTYAGFRPPLLKVKAGTPVRWTIYGDEVSGCTNRIIIPSYKISKSIPDKGKAIVEFTPTKTGNIPYSCWMGMYRGLIVAE